VKRFTAESAESAEIRIYEPPRMPVRLSAHDEPEDAWREGEKGDEQNRFGFTQDHEYIYSI